MKKVAIMQPYFLPYIGYFQLINAVDQFVIFDDINYINKGWINRNNILINNKASLFSLPIKEASQNKYIIDHEIANDGRWQNKLLKTIEQSYRKAPYYNQVFAVISKIIGNEQTNLSKYIVESLIDICQYLNINTSIIASSSQFKHNGLKATARIIDICKQLDGRNYINPIGGTELYIKADFEAENIQINFIKTNPIKYDQFTGDFVPNLSIIDLIMFNSKHKLQELINEFELI